MIMTQEEKEALERENSALRGQVALLERNNRIFSDRERNDLKQVRKTGLLFNLFLVLLSAFLKLTSEVLSWGQV